MPERWAAYRPRPKERKEAMNLKQKLAAYAEKKAGEKYPDWNPPLGVFDTTQCERLAFENGSALLEPLVLKLVEALEGVASGHTIYTLLEDQSGLPEDAVRTKREVLVTPETEIAREALAELDRLLEGK